MKKVCSLALLCTLTLMVSQVGADVIATRVRTAAFTVPANVLINVPLNNANSVTMPFVTTRDNQRVVINYVVECSVKSLSQAAYMDITIFVDGVATQPTAGPNAVCTSDGNVGAVGEWVSAVVPGVYVVPEPGIHAVVLQVQLVGEVAGNFGTIGPSSMVVAQ